MGRRAFATAIAGIAIGAAAGTGAFTFLYARGYSYLLEDPQACANCHVMQGQFDAWIKSGHRAVPGCNACHTPAGFLPKYATKALNGFLHSLAFTTGNYPDPPRIKGFNRAIAESACRSCHGELTASIDAAHGQPQSCTSCHQGVGHMR
jgi:cytochrome c nitrite reductase small subunit